MKVLLTGGSGFIGRALTKRILDFHQVVIVTRDENFNINYDDVQFQPIIEIGETESDSIKNIIKTHHPHVVIHLASLNGITKCDKNPEKAFRVNVLGTFNVVRACSQTASKLIFTSSREVYGNTTTEKSSEDDPLLPNNFYGTTKVLGEIMVRYAGQKNNLDYTILRLTNVYGPEGDENGVNRIIKMALKTKKIEIFGGEQILNVIYIDDVVDLISLVLNNKNSSKKVFNVGSNDNVKISDFAQKICNIINNNISIKYFPKIENESQIFRPNLEKLKNDLGYSAKTSLIDGLKKTINWYSRKI